MELITKLEQQLLHRERQHLTRQQLPIEAYENKTVTINGVQHLSFSSNNYLGLAKHPLVVKACQEALAHYGVGSGSAYLVSGYSAIHQELENQLASFLGYPRVLLLSSGYLANIGVISALFHKGDEIYSDKLNHASILDGCIMSRARIKRYPHCDTKALSQLITNSQSKNKVIITEGIFGMDGTLAPLAELNQIASEQTATLLVDDAHGLGVLGESGRGSIEHWKLKPLSFPILISTLGKAFGTYGAFVAADDLIIENLIQTTRTYLYTTALPPAIAAASLASLSLISKEHWRREKLQELIGYFRTRAKQDSLPLLDSSTQIQGIVLGCNEKALRASQRLRTKKIHLTAIRPPTVPLQSARLRISLTSEHTKEDIDYLLENLVDAIA